MSCRSSQSWHSQKPPELDSFAQSDPQETPGGRTSSERELSEETNLSLVPRLVWARCYFSKVADHLIRSLSNLLTMGFFFFLHTSSKYILLVVTQSGFESFNVFDISNLFGVFSLASSWLPSHKNWLVLSWEKIHEIDVCANWMLTVVDHTLVGTICDCKNVRRHLQINKCLKFGGPSINSFNLKLTPELRQSVQRRLYCQKMCECVFKGSPTSIISPHCAFSQSKSWQRWRCRWGTACTGWSPRRTTRCMCRSACSHI